jgi:hypothetical protein
MNIRQSLRRIPKIALSAPGVALSATVLTPFLAVVWLSGNVTTAAYPISLNPKDPGRLATFQLVAADPTATSSSVGKPYALSLILDTNGSLPQEIQASYTFDPQTIDLSFTQVQQSSCSGTPSVTRDSVLGSVSIRCILQSDAGRNGTRLAIAAATVVPKQPGSWQITPVATTSFAHRLVAGENGATTANLMRSSTGFQVSASSGSGPSFAASLLKPQLETDQQATAPFSFPILSSFAGQSCLKADEVTFRWPVPQGTVRFEYLWSESETITNPTNPTVSNTLTLPTKRGALQHFDIRPVGKNNSKGAVQRVTIRTCQSW